MFVRYRCWSRLLCGGVWLWLSYNIHIIHTYNTPYWLSLSCNIYTNILGFVKVRCQPVCLPPVFQDWHSIIRWFAFCINSVFAQISHACLIKNMIYINQLLDHSELFLVFSLSELANQSLIYLSKEVCLFYIPYHNWINRKVYNMP